MNDDDRRTVEEIRRQLDAITPPDPDGFYSVANVDPSADPVELYRQGLAMGSGSVWYVGTERVATAITGNGPRSKANAEFYASAPSIVRWLLQFVERIEEKLQDAKTDSDTVTRERDEMERIAEDTHAARAAAVARAEAAERELAAVPVEAIRRYFDHSDAYAAVQADTYEMHEGMNDCQQIAEWLGRRGEMQP